MGARKEEKGRRRLQVSTISTTDSITYSVAASLSSLRACAPARSLSRSGSLREGKKQKGGTKGNN
ncbi:hypothetical protein KFK09_029034 [Dendrobium nobile]|uniref:Uncharacterized protein n=1 Tax=Dendrobium nobile TaxID=94219 RepID=A0A8T3A4V8_DENNO|nr:hypothetical protein KFK09_029034 [Dendrobium nobile]